MKGDVVRAAPPCPACRVLLRLGKSLSTPLQTLARAGLGDVLSAPFQRGH